MFSLLDFLADLSTGVDHCHLKREYHKKRVLGYKADGSTYVNKWTLYIRNPKYIQDIDLRDVKTQNPRLTPGVNYHF